MRSMENQVCSSERRHSNAKPVPRYQDLSSEKYASESRHGDKKHRQRAKKHEHSRSREKQANHHSHGSNGSKNVPKEPQKVARQCEYLTCIERRSGVI